MGRMLQTYDPDVRRKIWKCLACGEEADDGPEVPIMETALAPRNGVETQPRSTVELDWKAAAISRLKALIVQVGSADAMRKEAEQIVAALKVAEVAGIPDLPWKGGRATQFGQKKTYPQCSQCGRQFTNTREYTGGKKAGTPAVCRDGCSEGAPP